MSDDDRWQYGEEVHVPGRPERKNPHLFEVRYHSGAAKLYDQFGFPLYLDPERAAEVLDDD